MRYSILSLFFATGVLGAFSGAWWHYGISRTLALSLVSGLAVVATRIAAKYWIGRNVAPVRAGLWALAACLAWSTTVFFVAETHQAFDVVAARKTRRLRQLTARQFEGLAFSFHDEPKTSYIRVHGTVEDEPDLEVLDGIIASLDYASIWPRSGPWGVSWDVTAPGGQILRREWTELREFVR